MKKFAGVLIVSDVDGTFLSKVAESLEKNIRAVERFKELGGLFAFATGRDLNALLRVIPDAGEISNAPIIVCNGTQIYDCAGGAYIYDCPIDDRHMIAEAVKLIRAKYPGIGVRFNSGDKMITPDASDMLKRDVHGDELEEMPLDELISADIKIHKCVIVDREAPENLDGVRKIFEELDKHKRLDLAKSYQFGFEALSISGTKGQAALWLKEHTGARVLYAIGDYENDIEMLRAADFGAAPQNALAQVRAAAQIITASCDDGAVADLIGKI